MSNLDKQIRDDLAERAQETANDARNFAATAAALRSVLDWANGLEFHPVAIEMRSLQALAENLRRTIADELAVSWEDTAPASQRQWAVQHPTVQLTPHHSEHAVLYTLSRLPGGTLVVRDGPDQPWRPETGCVCITVPDTGHYAGCPAEVVRAEQDAALRGEQA